MTHANKRANFHPFAAVFQSKNTGQTYHLPKHNKNTAAAPVWARGDRVTCSNQISLKNTQTPREKTPGDNLCACTLCKWRHHFLQLCVSSVQSERQTGLAVENGSISFY